MAKIGIEDVILAFGCLIRSSEMKGVETMASYKERGEDWLYNPSSRNSRSGLFLRNWEVRLKSRNTKFLNKLGVLTISVRTFHWNILPTNTLFFTVACISFLERHHLAHRGRKNQCENSHFLHEFNYYCNWVYIASF